VISLVTGATGFVGSHLAEALIKKGHTVRCTVRPTSDLVWLKSLPVEYINADITDRESMIPAIKGADYIFHAGGITKAKKESAYYKINAEASRILYELCREVNPEIKKIVHISSLAAAGPSETGNPKTESDSADPLTFYGKSKLEGERYAREYSRYLPIAIIRPPAVYGPREKDIFFYFQLIRRHINPKIGLREKYLSIVYVKDLVNAVMLAAESPQSAGQSYFVDDGTIYSWTEISAVIKRVIGAWTIPLFVPQWKVSLLAYIAEGLAMFSKKPALLNRQKIIELKQTNWTCTSQKIRNELGYTSQYPFERGCEETYAWYTEQRWL
jgi:dihydroflavonol-4-reductase